MNCRGWNPHIALYVEGDLELDLARQLEQHLGSCVECRSFAEGLRDTQADVRQLRNEIIDNSSLTRVRAGVLEQVRAIEEQRTWASRLAIWMWGGYRWRFAALSGFALVLTAVTLWRVSTMAPIVPPPQLVVNLVPPVLESVTEPAQVVKAKAPVKRHAAPAQRAKVEPKPDTVVQIQTDDPNVVIFWLIEQTGGR